MKPVIAEADFFGFLPEQVRSIVAGIAVTGLGFAAVVKWLDTRQNKLKDEITAEFNEKVKKLEDRVTHLESAQAKARPHLVEAIGLAAELGEKGKAVRAKIQMAVDVLE